MGRRFIAGVIVVVACGGKSHDQAKHQDPADAPDCGSLYEFDCPEGLHCYGAPSCGAKWSCQKENPPCSAAGPIPVCGCDGLVGAVPAGCLDRYAWRLDGFPHADPGTPCDANRSEPPATVTLRMELRGFDAFQEYHAKISNGSRRDGVIENGSADIVFSDVPHKSDVYWVALFADGGELGTCIDGIDEVGAFYPGVFDPVTMVATYAVGPGDLAYDCQDWLP